MRKMAIIALAVLLSGCAQSTVASTYTISQEDVRSISLTSTPPLTVSRVVVLANGVAEIIQSLNAQGIIVGRDISSTEDSLTDIPIVTSGHQVLPEKVKINLEITTNKLGLFSKLFLYYFILSIIQKF